MPMKLKRRLPIVVFILLSCAVFIGIPVYYFIDLLGSKYPVEMSSKISLALRQGLLVAVVIILLAWIGAGVDFGLSRIKKRTTRIFISLLTYLAPSVFCGLVALTILLITGTLAPSSGWEKLPDPPTTPVEVVSAGESTVYIRTESGDFYSCWLLHTSTCWKPETDPAKRIIKNDANTLHEFNGPPAVASPGDVLSMISVEYNDFGVNVKVHYAVMKDGTVRYLQENAGKANSNFGAGLLLSIIILPGVIALVGIYIGAGISTVLRWLANRIPEPDSPKEEIQ